MNDVQGPRRPASRSPRRRGPAARRLGELEFSQWYETPVFEPDQDELTEEAATAGHGPRRLMARARLSRQARSAKRHPHREAAPGPTAPAAAQPPAEPPAKPPARPPAPAAAKPPARPPAPAAEPEPGVEAWVSSGFARSEESMQLDLDKESRWRRRLNSLLDRWAEHEVAVAARLDRSLERVLNPSLPGFIASAARRAGPR